jgi:4-phosphoerythronate dehydrogenase
MKKPQLIIDSSLPYLSTLAEEVGEVTRLDSTDFSSERIKNADVLLIRSVVQCNEALLGGSSVRAIASATAGFDHIDTTYCEEHHIHWHNSPGCNALGVVQYVLSALSLWSLQRGETLQGKTIGIIGVGNVGGRLANRVTALGLQPLLYDPPRVEREGAEGFTTSLETLLTESDIITLHVPLTKDGRYPTQGMVDRAFLKRCSRRPLLINACRGGVTPSMALHEALDKGWIRDVILDCWEGEPTIDGRLARKAFIATPHIAGWTADGKWRGSRMALEAICDDLALNKPKGLWDASCLPTPSTPMIDLSCYPKGERVRRALLHTANPSATTQELQATPQDFNRLRKSYLFPREASAYHVVGYDEAEALLLRQLDFNLS